MTDSGAIGLPDVEHGSSSTTGSCSSTPQGAGSSGGSSSSSSAGSVVQTAGDTVTLSWQPPTEYTDGTVMTTLAGYHIHYGTAPQDYPSTIQVANPGIATYVVQGLSPGTYYFAVSAYDSSGEESEDSQEITVTVNGSGTSGGSGTSSGSSTSSAAAVDPPASSCSTSASSSAATGSAGAATGSNSAAPGGSSAAPGGSGATLGSTSLTPPAAVDGGDENTMAGSPITVGAQPISISSITVWINSAQAAPNNQYQVAIYTDSGGQPGSLLVASSSQTIAPQSWNTVPLSATLSANTKYWLLYNTNSTVPSLNEMSLSASTTSNGWYSGTPGSAAYGTWPNTAPRGYLESPQQAYSMYVTYQTASSTLGTETATPPAAVDGGDENTMAGSSIAVGAQSISISSVTVWINSAQAAPNNQYQVAIYTDSGGQPGSLVAASSSQTIAPQSWNTVPLSATLSANTTYWLLYNTNSTVPSLNEMSLSASTTSNGWYSGTPGSAPFGTWPNSAPRGYLENPQQAYSMYVTYQTASGTLGSNTSSPPAVVDSGDENTLSGSPIKVGAQPISVASIAVWINSAQAAPDNQFEVAIYTDNGGQPGSLVAASGTQSINPQSWNTVPLSATLNPNSTYWLLYNTNATNPGLNEMSLSPSSTVNSWYSGNPGSAAFGKWPSSASAGHFQNPAQVYSIYLNYQ